MSVIFTSADLLIQSIFPSYALEKYTMPGCDRRRGRSREDGIGFKLESPQNIRIKNSTLILF